MTVVYIISFLLIAFGIVRILGLTPESIGADVSAILDRKKSLRDNAMRARGKKRTNKLVLWLDKIRRALSDTGKEKAFGVACAVALLLMILGCVGAIVIGNPFLAPVLAIALAMIPFLYLLRTVEQYEEQVKLELETGLSAITSSYERTMNLKSAVEENIDNLKPPVKGLFQSFLVEISVINPDVKAAICHLRERVKDCVWEEWCDTLISCQDDSQLIGTLYPVVEKLTDMRIVNAELKVMISENKREYYIMALMVVANIPLLYFLNKEWYGALMYTTFGKVTLAICGAVMLFTFLRMQKYWAYDCFTDYHRRDCRSRRRIPLGRSDEDSLAESLQSGKQRRTKGQEKDGRHRTLPTGLCYQAGREAASERVQTRQSCD